MSLIISIETSGKACSVALAENGHLSAQRQILAENYPHARVLHVFIQEVIQETGISTSNLQAVAVSAGPGSYTGLRIGVAAAKGLCFALDIPLIEISTLWLMALRAKTIHPEYEQYVPMIDARRMEVYTQTFDNNLKALTAIEPRVLDENYFHPFSNFKTLLCGDGSIKCTDLIQKKNNLFIDGTLYPQAENMCEIAKDKFNRKEFVDVKYFEPFYLKEFQSQSAFHKK